MENKLLYLIRIIFFALSFRSTYSLYFKLEETKEKCFIEEFQENNVNINLNKR